MSSKFIPFAKKFANQLSKLIFSMRSMGIGGYTNVGSAPELSFRDFSLVIHVQRIPSAFLVVSFTFDSIPQESVFY
jgi:hypothetical protein